MTAEAFKPHGRPASLLPVVQFVPQERDLFPERTDDAGAAAILDFDDRRGGGDYGFGYRALCF